MSIDFDEDKLRKELDWVKSRVFIGKGNTAFLAPLMCSMEFRWMPGIGTAETDGTYVGWDPKFWEYLSPETRETVLVHELWHPALLHMCRRGDRDPETWNQACDYRINNDLLAAGFSFKGIEWACLDPSIDDNGRLCEEEIYDLIKKTGKKPKPMPSQFEGMGKDLKDPSPEKQQKIVNNVIKATYEHELAQGAGTTPVSVKEMLGKFLAPVVPWEKELMQFCTDLLEVHRSWARPNRRYTDVYMPYDVEDDGRLDHLIYYLDVSGSCSKADVVRFNSEVKYIFDVLKPRKLTVCQFTTQIVHEQVFNEGDSFDEIIRYGTGGTSLTDVRKHMIDNQPTAAIVFSDLDCPKMQPLPFHVPTIWVGIRASGRSVNFGKLIHIRG